jgi:hypothetical protein
MRELIYITRYMEQQMREQVLFTRYTAYLTRDLYQLTHEKSNLTG